MNTASRITWTTLDDVLLMVACSYDYGHSNQIVWHFFWQLAGEVITDEEIDGFLQRAYLSEEAAKQGYGEADANSAKEIIVEWRHRHMKVKVSS